MKLHLILSLLFFIAASFASIHEVEHIKHHDDSSCFICTVSQNLVSADAVEFAAEIEVFHFEKIIQNTLLSYLYIKTATYQNRAPPKIS
ncbi:hypothetical protein CVO_09225 [Sulfurimonas sp. CVO]|jgi:hypothetical protein|uniref:Uncharacterized protein n=1 Tax=Sulfurimonas xiamenensis TaxID=2590021 RepID=A0AAJ4A213_9BACT|nr:MULTISPECIES: hypothetical protein [Sulfurimonas]PLY14939.1 MAG: hypothetical protein C0628_03465 [Sulfurimonas sp.]QFR42434.1 hypothetical protein FJR47_00275 [Sulfurimonas xiamenensis]QHG91991.1 hypothetical protein CVO_09225 [Sulfurimonas sp. CVO]